MKKELYVGFAVAAAAVCVTAIAARFAKGRENAV